MSASLSRDHTITSSWRTKDAYGRNVTCKASPGTRLTDLSRAWRSLDSQALPVDSNRISIPSTSAEQPLEMETVSGHSPLRSLLASFETGDFFQKTKIARAMAAQLAWVHASHVLHGNVSLDSFLVDPADQSLAIIDFTGAVQLAPGARLGDVSRDTLSESILLTPEGARHTDLPIDHRTDLYALGCAYYELFAGRPVFPVSDRVALIHAHLAKLPRSFDPTDDMPPMLARIVTALLSKQADDRYQRAANLVIDLDTVCNAIERGRASEVFPLRLQTIRTSLARGEFLFGRDQQESRLLDTFATVKAGQTKRILVTGPPGVGKSALCRQFARAVHDRGGRVAIGKFEQLQTSAPYLGIVRCFETLIDQILSDRDQTVGELADRMRSNLNENLAVLNNILPSFHLIFGMTVPQEPLSGAGARDRLAQCFLGFLAIVASADKPTVLMFDDLQWADSASLDLLRRISGELSGSVLLLGTTRSEQDRAAPLSRASEALTVQDSPPLLLDLMALTRSDVEDLLVGIFGHKCNQIDAAALIYAKTLGSPLFISQFLNKIGDGVVLDPAGAWDIRAIAQMDGAANVGEFLSARIRSLDPLSRQILATGACFGMSFDRASLDGLLRIDDAVLSERLSRMVGEGFVVSTGTGYLFAHDRVREAAYALAGDRERTHRIIGRRLLATYEEDGLHQQAYTIAAHLKAAGDLSGEPGLEDRYLHVVHIAAQRAHDAAAFDIARSYADTAMTSAKADRWATDYAAMAATLLVKANSTVSQHDHARFDHEYDADLARLTTNEHRLKLALVRVMSLNARALCEEAIEVGLDGLRLVGIEFPRDRDRQREAIAHEVAAFQETMAGRSPDELVHLPPLTDECIAIAMQVLFRLAPNAHATTKLELFALLAVRNANLMLRNGRDGLASGIVMTLALVLARVTGNLSLADNFGRVAMAFDAREGRRSPASVSFVYTYFFSHWLHPLEASLPANLDGMRTGFEFGDVQFGSFHAAAYVIHLVSLGAPLGDVVRAGRAHDRLIAGRVKVASFHCQLEIAFAQALQGMTATVTSLSRDAASNTDEVLLTAGTLAPADRGFYLARHLQLSYVFRDFEAAVRYADAAFEALPGVAGNFVEAEIVMFGLLAELALGGDRTARFRSELARLYQWAKLNPGNFGCRLALVQAELARCEGRAAEAIANFGRAVREAKSQRFGHMAALAAELAARFFSAMADDVAAGAYLREAVTLYGEWGAQAKVSALRDEFPGVSKTDLLATGESRENAFDGVLLAAARAISAEIDLERLLQQIMTSVQEVSGATYGALILSQEAGYFVEVVGRHGERVTVCDALAEPLASSRLIPASIVASVQKERVTLVLSNAGSSAFSRDPYVRGNGVVSVLCAPLAGGGKLDGFIYLENNLTVGSFSPRLEQAVQILAAQAAIALANARLFALLDEARGDLADANRDLERKIELRTDELAVAHALAVERAAEAERARQAERDANEAKSRFLSVVSHEIRTPMNGVLGMLQLLDPARLDTKARRQVEIARNSGLTLVGLIDSVLDYSRLELGDDGVTHETFRLRGLVDSAVEIFRPALEAKNITLSIDVDAPADIMLLSDARGIARILMNLVGNATKFTSEGEVAVTAQLQGDVRPEMATLSISVRDTGVGIPETMQKRIFEEFVQADSSVARRHAGTGLGLAICSRIVSLLGGAITVSSTTGVGSLFVATFPVAISKEPLPKTAPAIPTASLSVMVVDDDDINREITSGLIERLGHSALCADSGLDAVSSVGHRAFDAIILDLHMPDIDGLETASRIRSAMGAEASPPIIILTADMTETSRQRCLEQGVTRILAKPLRYEALADMLADLPVTRDRASPTALPCLAIDRLLFAERCELLGVEQMVRLTRRYRRSAKATIEAIGHAALTADHPMVARLAHRVQSAAGSLYFNEMAVLAQQLESAAVSSDQRMLGIAIADLRAALPRSVAAAMAELRMLRRHALGRPTVTGLFDAHPRRSTSHPSL